MQGSHNDKLSNEHIPPQFSRIVSELQKEVGRYPYSAFPIDDFEPLARIMCLGLGSRGVPTEDDIKLIRERLRNM